MDEEPVKIYLIDELSPMDVILVEHLLPQREVAFLDKKVPADITMFSFANELLYLARFLTKILLISSASQWPARVDNEYTLPTTVPLS